MDSWTMSVNMRVICTLFTLVLQYMCACFIYQPFPVTFLLGEGLFNLFIEDLQVSINAIVIYMYVSYYETLARKGWISIAMRHEARVRCFERNILLIDWEFRVTIDNGLGFQGPTEPVWNRTVKPFLEPKPNHIKIFKPLNCKNRDFVVRFLFSTQVKFKFLNF